MGNLGEGLREHTFLIVLLLQFFFKSEITAKLQIKGKKKKTLLCILLKTGHRKWIREVKICLYQARNDTGFNHGSHNRDNRNDTILF